jgi:hypothetical protein
MSSFSKRLKDLSLIAVITSGAVVVEKRVNSTNKRTIMEHELNELKNFKRDVTQKLEENELKIDSLSQSHIELKSTFKEHMSKISNKVDTSYKSFKDYIEANINENSNIANSQKN